MKKNNKENKKVFLKCCYGISSKANDDEGHVPMFDFDGNIKINEVVQYLKYIQNDNYMGDIYVIKSTHGFNAICLDIWRLYDIYCLLKDVLCPVDRDFTVFGWKRGYYTLRFDRDKKLVKILKSDNETTKSFVHKCFLEWFFNIKIDFDNTFNSYDKLKIIQYPSTKNGYHMVKKYIPRYLEVVKNL